VNKFSNPLPVFERYVWISYWYWEVVSAYHKPLGASERLGVAGVYGPCALWEARKPPEWSSGLFGGAGASHLLGRRLLSALKALEAFGVLLCSPPWIELLATAGLAGAG